MEGVFMKHFAETKHKRNKKQKKKKNKADPVLCYKKPT